MPWKALLISLVVGAIRLLGAVVPVPPLGPGLGLGG